MGECETRTQGASIAALWARLRTQDRAAQRGRAARASFRKELLGTDELPRLQQRYFDLPAHGEHREPLLERRWVHADHPQLALTCFERQLEVADEDGTRPVEDPWADAEDALHRRHEVGGGVDDGSHAV